MRLLRRVVRLTGRLARTRPQAARPAGSTLAARVAGESSTDPVMSWLCPNPGDRDRFIEMQGRLRTARVATMGMAGVLAVGLAPHIGWFLVPITATMIAVVVSGAWHLERRRRPELWVFFTTVVNFQVVLGFAVAVSGGPRSPLVCLAAIPMIMVATRFSGRGLIIGAPISALLVIGATLGVDPGYVVRHPETLGAPLAFVMCAALYLHPLLSSDIRHRATSNLDELTGLLNRRALESRLAEISQQAALSGQAVSVIAGDLDHFKRVNDRWGHATGDAVLQQATEAMRRCLRQFELLYRIGGEEFLLVLPGAGEGDAVKVAGTLRTAIENAKPGGLAITCSFGVATLRGAAATRASLMRASDTALYSAKRAGRNRVELYRPAFPVAA